MKISETDHSTLARALVLEESHETGIFPRGSGQHKHFERLAGRGLIRFIDWGSDIDGEVENEVKIYRLTLKGKALAQALEMEERPQDEETDNDEA